MTGSTGSPVVAGWMRALAAPGRRAEWAAAAAILALGLIARVWQLDAQSFSMDELTELRFARFAVPQIIVNNDGFPPLYSLLLREWLKAFPQDASARVLSVLIGTLTIVPVWQLARRAGGRTAGLAAALIVAVSPPAVWYSQEVRAYALYLLEAAVALALFFRALDSGRRADWTAYTLAAAAGAYVHYYFALLIATNLLILAMERLSWDRVRVALAAHLWTIPLLLPLLWLLRIDLSYWHEGQFAEPSLTPAAVAYTYFTLIAGFAVGPATRELHTMAAAQAAKAAMPWLVLTAIAAGCLGAAAIRAFRGGPWLRRLVTLAATPVALCIAATLVVGVGYRPRYLIWVAVPVQVILGAGLARAPGSRSAALAASALGIVSAASLWNHHHVSRYMTEDMRAAAAYVSTHSPLDVPVVVISGYMSSVLSYYLRDLEGGRRVVPMARVDRDPDPAPALDSLRAVVPPGRPFWLVYSRPFDADPKGRLRAALESAAGLSKRAELAGVTLYSGRGF
jgi:mannosyltransferase